MMHETDYAYAVARVRANELNLLSSADIEQLIAADDYKAAMRRLSDAGWGDSEGVTDYASYLENYFSKTWDLLTEVMFDPHELDLLIIRNDMQNVKAALKKIVSQHDAKDLYVKSTVYDAEKIINAIDERDFGALPEFMQAPVAEAYDILVSTGNGQLSDAVIDKATLEHIKELGRESHSKALSEIAERMCATADIKMALRCAATGKSRDFIERSLCECDTISASSLANAATQSVDAVLEYVGNTSYAKGAEQYKISTSAFEKWCDDLIMECVRKAKYTTFGPDPLVAYYVARDAEIKTVRIILSAKINNLPADVIRERVRALYV